MTRTEIAKELRQIQDKGFSEHSRPELLAELAERVEDLGDKLDRLWEYVHQDDYVL